MFQTLTHILCCGQHSLVRPSPRPAASKDMNKVQLLAPKYLRYYITVLVRAKKKLLHLLQLEYINMKVHTREILKRTNEDFLMSDSHATSDTDFDKGHKNCCLGALGSSFKI